MHIDITKDNYKLFVSCSFDKTICVWDFRKYHLIHKLKYLNIIMNFILSKVQIHLLSVGNESVICKWNILTEKLKILATD